MMSQFRSECYFFEMYYACPYIAKRNMFALQLVKYLFTLQNIVCLEYIIGIYREVTNHEVVLILSVRHFRQETYLIIVKF